MADLPLALTDPARELAELCSALHHASNDRGEVFLAHHFGVEAWSREFFQVVFTITERCALVQQLVCEVEMDADVRDEIIRHVGEVMGAFTAHSMRSPWSQGGLTHVGPINSGPIKAISPSVRQRVAYRKLTADEVKKLSTEIEGLLKWLRERQLSKQDFLRQALADGLDQFLFRLKRLKWVGWGYALDAMRDVIAAYMLLERTGATARKDPEAAAILQKTKKTIQSVYAKVTTVKDIADTGDWLIRAYGAGSLVYQAGRPLVAGLLSAP